MLYPFTIDTEVTVSYIQNNRYEDEKKPSPNVYMLKPRTWLMTYLTSVEELNNPLTLSKLNNIIKVYYGMMIERIKGYVKPEDKDSLFIRRLDEKSLEFVINDKVDEGDTDDGKRTFDDICNHFDLLLDVLSKHHELNVVRYSSVSNNKPISLEDTSTLCNIMDKHVCNTHHLKYDNDNNESGKTVTIGIYHDLLTEHPPYQRYQNHFVGSSDKIKDEDVIYYYADRVDNPVKVNNIEYSRGGLIRNHVEGDDIINSLYPHVKSHFIKSIVTHVSRIIVNTVTYPDGSMANTVETGLRNHFTQYNVFEYWANSGVVITKFIEKVMKECTLSTVATDCEILYPDEPFTLKPDTLYSFNVNEQILRVIEHELLRLNLPYVFIRRADGVDDLQWLIISEGIERHLAYLKRYIELTGIESGEFLNSYIQVNELHQGSLENGAQVLGKGILVNDTDTAVNLSHLLYGILKGVYV